MNDPAIMLAWARHYQTLGWSIFPLSMNSKAPIAGTRGLHDASNDPALIEHWWGTQHPGAPIGIAAGASQLVAIDCDPAPTGDPEQHGLKTFERLAQAAGHHLPITVSQQTLRPGGRHFIFCARNAPADWLGPDRSRRWRVKLEPGIDVRGPGAYVVASPSRVCRGKGTAGEYRWLPGQGPDIIRPAPAPAWLFEALRKPRPTTSQRASASIRRPTHRQASGNHQRLINWSRSRVRGAVSAAFRKATVGNRDAFFSHTSWSFANDVSAGKFAPEVVPEAIAELTRAGLELGQTEAEMARAKRHLRGICSNG